MKGLRGKKGVVIPADNVQDLNLKDEIIEAIKTGKFEIYAASKIEEVCEFMMEKPFQEIARRVREKLKQFHSLSREA